MYHGLLTVFTIELRACPTNTAFLFQKHALNLVHDHWRNGRFLLGCRKRPLFDYVCGLKPYSFETGFGTLNAARGLFQQVVG